MDRLYTLLVAFLALSGGDGQTTTPTDVNATTTPTPNPERGLIVTTTGGAHIRHIPIMPYYESGEVSLPGLGFSEYPDMELRSVDVDYQERNIFMYDSYHSSIIMGTNYSAALDLDMSFYLYHTGVSRGFVQLVVDWTSHTLYWTDSIYRWIVAAPADPDKMEEDYYKIIVDTDLHYPDGIALDPFEGKLFWSDNGDHPRIESSNLQGKGRTTLITSHLYSPWTLEADYKEKRLYWIDSMRQEIQSIKYDGTDRKLLARVPSSVLFDIAIFRDLVVLTDIGYSPKMSFLHKETGKQIVNSIHWGEDPLSVAIYHEDAQTFKDKDYCAELNCSQLCLSTNISAVCDCSVGYTYNQDTKMCEADTLHDLRAIVLASSTEICLVDIRTIATERDDYDLYCIFSVIPRQNIPTTPAVPSQRRKRQITTVKPTTQPTAATSPAPQPTKPLTTPAPTPPPTAAPGDMIKLMDVDMRNRVVYFVDASDRIYRRPIDLPIENEVKDLLVSASGTVTGLAYDWIDGNLFWCEDTGRIMIVNPGDRAVRKVTDGINGPEQLVILPHERLLAWVTSNRKLQTMHMNDVRYNDVATDIGEVRSLVVDNENKLFYWLANSDDDAATVLKSLPFSDGNEPDTVRRTLDITTSLFNVYKSFFKWIHESDGSTYLTSGDSSFSSIGEAVLGDDTFKPIAMKVLDESTQVGEQSPCLFENGKCEQICVTRHDSDKWQKYCECRLGFTVDQVDIRKCVTDSVADNFILVTDWTNEELQQISLDDDVVHAFLTPSPIMVNGIGFHRNDKRVLWAPYFDSEIYSANLDGSDVKILTDIGNWDFPYRFDVDLTTNNIYYTTSETFFGGSYIGIVTPFGETIHLTDYMNTGLADIVVHPGKGWAFFTDLDGSVRRCDMDGNNMKTLISNPDSQPDGLAIDFTRDVFYWSDALSGILQECDYDAENCTTFHEDDNSDMKDVDTDGEYVYYVDFKKDHIVEVKIQDKTTKIYGEHLGKLDTMALYKSSSINIQPASTACSDRDGKGDCSTICLPTPLGRTCACEQGITLKDDERTCKNVYQCDEVIRQSEFVQIIIDRSCLRHLGDRCKFKCPLRYKSVKDDATLTCTNVGWENQTDTLCEDIFSTTTRSTVIEPQGQSASEGLSKSVVGAIVAVMVIIILALIVAVGFLMYRRKRDQAASQFAYGRASFRSANGDIGIENPSYPKLEIIDDDPYSGIDPSQMQTQFASPVGDDGFVNPLYANAPEPLPDVGQITTNQTTESSNVTGKQTFDAWKQAQ